MNDTKRYQNAASVAAERLVSAQVDEFGAVEATFKKIFNLQNRQQPEPYDWPMQKTFSDKQLRYVGSSENYDFIEQGFCESEAKYRGHLFSKDFLSIEGSVKTEPIQSHPRFEEWAGTPTSPNRQNAIWLNAQGVNQFSAWRSDFAKLAGIVSYLKPEFTYHVTWMSSTPDLTTTPGKKYLLPSIPNFSPDDFEYLLTSVNQEQNGGAWKITAQLLAAPAWSVDLYSF